VNELGKVVTSMSAEPVVEYEDVAVLATVLNELEARLTPTATGNVLAVAGPSEASKSPDGIVLSRDRDLVGRGADLWVRRALFAVLPLVALLAFLDLFGQRPQVSEAAAPAATLQVLAPSRLRSGVLYEARFTVNARRELHDAVLVLDRGWFEGMTVNSLAPSPGEETSTDGRPTFHLGRVPPGRSHVLFVYFQINPTTFGRRSQTTRLLDGKQLVATIDRRATVFP
jgi:hypothetical protein